MNGDDLCFASAAQLAVLLRDRRVSPVEIVDALLERIDRLDPMLRAYITVDADGARAAARAAEIEIGVGAYRGPLHGVPVAYKDIIDVRGLPTTAGSRIPARTPAQRDSAVAARLRRAGAIAVGKLNTTEFAAGTMEVFGEARNPWDLARTTGGSSAGCGAALAAGLIPLAIGTDTGGSIRIPSSYCGITGLKPTYGRVSSAGIVPLSWSLDHPGPMGRTVRDVALALAEIAGPDDADPSTHPRPVPRYDRALRHDLRGVVLGRPRGFFSEGLDPDVAAAVDRFIATAHGLGAIVVDIDLPFAEYSGAAFWAIAYSEALAVHRDNVRARHRDFTAPFLERILAAACLSAADLVTAQCLSKNLAASFAEAFSNVDVLVAPTTPTPASAIAAKTNHGDRNRFTRPANLNGGPAIAVPCGFNAEGLPLSVQLMGRAWNEETVLRVAFAVEREIVTDRRPALATGASTPVQEAAASPHVAESDVQAAIQVAASLGVALEEAQARRVAAQWTVCRDVLDRARPAVRIAI